MEEKTKLLLKKLKELPDFDRVKFIFLFGSKASGKASKISDYDYAIYYDGNGKERFEFRKEILGRLSEKFDVQIFQDLPLYVRISVLKGKLVYAEDVDFVYAKAYETIKAFDDFKKGYYEYIKGRKLLT